MKAFRRIVFPATVALAAMIAGASRADTPATHWLPPSLPPPPANGPALTQGAYLKPEQGQAILDAALVQFPDRAQWEAYAQHVRVRIQEGAGLSQGLQARCASLARMGAVVLAIDMFGYGDSMQLVGQAAHRHPFALTLQTRNAMRAVDFLTSLEGVDPQRIAVSGESGGGTGRIDESRVTTEKPALLRVFGVDFPIPPHALDVAAIEKSLRKLQV